MSHFLNPEQELLVGATSSASLVVAHKHLAAAFAEDAGEAYPEVLSTPSLIGLMERACAAVFKRALLPGQMSVGVRVNVVHKAPTPLGANVTVTARLSRVEGRLFVFEVSASDSGGVVATGEHARAVVVAADVESGANLRVRANLGGASK